MAKGKRRRRSPDEIPKILPKGFTKSLTARCDDCEYRGSLDNVGKPRFRNGVRMTSGCEGCNGKGRVAVPIGKRTDPYFTGRW